jgi:cyanophycin synthetase
VRNIARIAAGWFDHYICRRDDSLRGRAPDEIPLLLQEALLERGVPAEQIAVIPDEQEATAAALTEARPGDLVLIFGDAITRTWEQIASFRPAETERRLTRRSRLASDLAASAEQDVPLRSFVRDLRGVRFARETEAED